MVTLLIQLPKEPQPSITAHNQETKPAINNHGNFIRRHDGFCSLPGGNNPHPRSDLFW